MENKFDQERFDALIERHLKKDSNRVRRAFEEGKKSVVVPKLDSSIKLYPKNNKVIFRKSITTKLYYTIVGISGLIITGIMVGTGMDAWVLGIGVLVLVACLSKGWNPDDNNVLQLDFDGVEYNGIPYKWETIEKTVILVEVFRGQENELINSYLVLGLKTGKNKILDTTELSMKGTLIGGRISHLSHFVAYFNG